MIENPFTPESKKAKKSLFNKKYKKPNLVSSKIKENISALAEDIINYHGFRINKDELQYLKNFEDTVKHWNDPYFISTGRKKFDLKQIIKALDNRGYITELNFNFPGVPVVAIPNFSKLKHLKKVYFKNDQNLDTFLEIAQMSKFFKENPQIIVEIV